MRKVERYLEKVYNRRICDNYDHVLLVIGDEGNGKSTLMLGIMLLWEVIRGRYEEAGDVPPDEILSNTVHTTEDFQTAISTSEERSSIALPDATRVLHRKDAMKSGAVETEKDLLDVRTNEHFILLGYQYWSNVPSLFIEGRAKGCFYLPTRGTIRAYSPESITEREQSGEWPPADLVGTFPSLEGTDIWEKYNRIDKRRKAERMGPGDSGGNEGEEELTVRDVVADVRERGIEEFVSTNPTNGQRYIDPDLLEFEFGLSARKAKQAKKVLAREFDVSEHAGEVSEA